MPRIIDALEQLFTVDSLASGPSLLINYSSASGSFSVGETVTGGTSGATLVVNTSIPPQVTGSTVTGTFQVGETITGGDSGATATVDNFFAYDFPSGAAPLENGQIDFFESGSSTVRKTTYSDIGESIPNPNPLILRGDGRVPDVYGTGTYRVVVRTSSGIQILARDPVGGDQGLTFGSDWSALEVYSVSDVVRDDARYWQSLNSNNVGNQPSINGGIDWVELPFDDIATNTTDIATNTTNIATNTTNITNIYQSGIADWNPSTSYQASAWARSVVDNAVYQLLPSGDASNEPSASPTDWKQVALDDYVKLTHTLSSGTSGGTFNGGSWQTRPINTKDNDSSNICTLSSNQFTLPAGTYQVSAKAQADRVDGHKTRLKNITANSTTLTGLAAYAPAAANSSTHSFINGTFTIASSATFELQHYAQTTTLLTGFGLDNAGGGEPAVYAVVELWRLI